MVAGWDAVGLACLSEHDDAVDQSALVVAEVEGGEPRTIAAAARTAYANARFSPGWYTASSVFAIAAAR